MKKLKILALSLVLLAFVVNNISAQAGVSKDFPWLLRTSDGVYPSIETMAVFTPSGNILHKQVFLLDLDDSLVPDKGINKESFITWISHDGVLWTLYDIEGIVFPDGKAIIIFHSNGAGDTTPPNKK